MDKKLIIGCGLLAALVGCEKRPSQSVFVGGSATPIVGGVSVAPIAITSKVIVLMAGQSNMLGEGQTQDQYYPQSPAVNMVGVTYGNRYAMKGPGAAAGIYFTQAHPGVEFIGIMCAVGSTSIDQWGPGSALLEACLSRARLVRDAEKAPIVAMLWDQGEQDAFLGTQDWPLKLTTLVRYSQQSLGLSSLPVVYAQLGQTDDTYNGQWDPFKLVQAQAQQPGFTMIQTDDLPAVAHVHHDGAANLVIGQRFYRSMGI